MGMSGGIVLVFVVSMLCFIGYWLFERIGVIIQEGLEKKKGEKLQYDELEKVDKITLMIITGFVLIFAGVAWICVNS